MSTNSSIGVRNDDGGVEYIYCHWDGSIGNNGRVLMQYFNSKEAAQELVDLGDVSALDVEGRDGDETEVGEIVEINGCNVNVYTGKRAGKKRYAHSPSDMVKNRGSAEYIYVFDDSWWVACRETGWDFEELASWVNESRRPRGRMLKEESFVSAEEIAKRVKELGDYSTNIELWKVSPLTDKVVDIYYVDAKEEYRDGSSSVWDLERDVIEEFLGGALEGTGWGVDDFDYPEFMTPEDRDEQVVHIVLKPQSFKENRRPHGRMLKEFYFEDPEDARWELNQGEYECCYCGREVTGAEGYCKNDDGEICCIDCYKERFGKNESRHPRGRMLHEGVDIDIPENDPSVEEEDRIRREKAHEDKIKKLANSVLDILKRNDHVEISAWTEKWVGRNYIEDALEVAELFKKDGYYCYIRDPYSHHHVREITISKTRLPSSYGEML